MAFKHRVLTPDSSRTAWKFQSAFIAASLVAFGALFGTAAQTSLPGLGALEATIRVLTYNVLGKGDLCKIRHTRFGNLLATRTPAVDIVGLQEFFGNQAAGIPINSCNPDFIRAAATKTGRYLTNRNHPCRSIVGFPTLNGCLFRPDRRLNGGLALLTQHRIEFEESAKWDDHTGQPRPQGYLFVRIALNRASSARPLRLDVYVVHLQGECGIDCQRKELEQLARRITANSRTSGNPVIVMGDFNFDGPRTRAALANVNSRFPGYRHIMEVLRNPRDLWLEAHPDGPGERGLTGDDCPIVRPVIGSPELEVNTFRCTNPQTQCGCRGHRIDYIFHVTDRRFTNSNLQLHIARPDDVRVVRFFELDDGPRRVSVSDHYGVEATVQLRRPAVVAH
jgi:endonuclease/exonuclease/phosphatase family metal-dependent hydrolase